MKVPVWPDQNLKGVFEIGSAEMYPPHGAVFVHPGRWLEFVGEYGDRIDSRARPMTFEVTGWSEWPEDRVFVEASPPGQLKITPALTVTVYVVMRQVGEWSDQSHAPVCYYLDKAKAEEAVVRFTEAAREAAQASRRAGREWMKRVEAQRAANPDGEVELRPGGFVSALDPGYDASWDDDEALYHVEEVPPADGEMRNDHG